jgi:hypothetical protein
MTPTTCFNTPKAFRSVRKCRQDNLDRRPLAAGNSRPWTGVRPRARMRSAAIWSFVRIDQTCLGRSGGLAPTSLPLFQGPRLSEGATGASLSCMVILLVSENDQHGLGASVPGHRLASAIRAIPVAASHEARRRNLTPNGHRGTEKRGRGHRAAELSWLSGVALLLMLLVGTMVRREPRPVGPPPSGVPPRSASMPRQARAVRQPDTRRRAPTRRHQFQPHRDQFFAAPRSPEKFQLLAPLPVPRTRMIVS